MSKLARFGKSTATKAAKTYPTIDDKELGLLANYVAVKDEEFKTLEGTLKTSKKTLRDAAFPKWDEHNRTAESTTSVVIKAYEEVNGEVTPSSVDIMVTFQEGYRSGVERDEVIKIVGEQAAAAHFEDKFTLSIDSTKIPHDKQNELVEGLLGLLDKLGIDPSVIASKELTVPKKGFHDHRAKTFTAEQNAALDAILATPALVKRRPAA